MKRYNERSQQFFVILSGTATLEINCDRQILSQHEGVEISPGIAHQIFNQSDQGLEFLVISQSPSHRDLILVC
ncbi:cupin domain-containing protein [Nostoc sp. LEGE 06077]|uniref:cupin domain-containing protein n=1 Tax=Nostoc sp. LEGE 06077 TaxID=915325 RepID=UPI002AD48915|nr:cupin domain-containing protein [Nostoc sp. LEGE 06077]